MSESSSKHWLLVLGSNVAADAQLNHARAALAELGQIVATSEQRAGEDVNGGERVYLNQLVELHANADAAQLVLGLKSIERQQGRSDDRMALGMCDLDIDLLARLDDAGKPEWLAHKPRQIPAVQALLVARFGLEGAQ